MMDLAQYREKMASCYRMHQESILSPDEKKTHPCVEMGGRVFQLTSQFGPTNFDQYAGCQTALQKHQVTILYPDQPGRTTCFGDGLLSFYT